MYNTEIEMLEKILDKNLFYGRLGKTFKTRDKFFSMRDMSLDTALKSLEKIKDRISDEFYVTFYGGEPLLNFSLIKEIV